MQYEESLYDAAKRGDVSAVRQLTATRVNLDCMPYEVYPYYIHLLEGLSTCCNAQHQVFMYHYII